MKQLFTFLTIVLLASFASAAPTYTLVQTYTPVCNTGNYSYFYKISASGMGGVTVSSITSSNNAVMSGPNVSYSTTSVGNLTYFEFYGITSGVGTFFLTVILSDGSGNTTFTGGNIVVQPSSPPSFTQNPITLCTSQGTVNLNDYVTVPGDNFVSSDLEWNFSDATVNTNDSPLSYGQVVNLNYDATIGYCNYTVQGSIVLYEAASTDISTESTDCNTSAGSAELYTNGDDLPFTIVWTTGQQNTSTVSGLAAGAYAVQVTTAHGCISTQPFIIENNGVTASVSTTDVSCFGGTNGGIEITPDGLTQPLNIIWSSGHSALNITGIPAGYYTVNIKDANNCAFVKDIQVFQPDFMELYSSMNMPGCGEANGDVTVTEVFGGTSPYTYAWSTGGTEDYIEDIGYGVYSVTVTDQNGCMQVKTFYVSEDNGADLYGTATGSDCGSANGYIVTSAYPPSGSSIQSVGWSNGAVTPDIFNLAPDNYVCTVTTNTGCHTIKGWNVAAKKPLQNNICVVTVDDQTTTNLVVWEKVQTTGIGYYKIYRETSQSGYFALIDTVNATSETVFNDVVASPMERSWTYKISAVNTCNEESPLSLPHQTIHLDVLENLNTGGVTVGWNAYTGTSFTNYFISRYTNANGWEELATLPATQLSYEDNVPLSTPGLDYVVEMELTTPCSSEKAQDFNSSRSNKDKAQFSPGQGTGASNNSVAEEYLNAVTISPNPAVDQLFIVQDVNAKLDITVFTLEGQLLQSESINGQEETIDISKLAPGVYIVNVALNGIAKNHRIVKL